MAWGSETAAARRRPGRHAGAARRRLSGAPPLLFLLLLLSPSPARGFVLHEDELEERSLVLGLLARDFTFVLTGSSLRPPYNTEDADPTALSLLDLRVSAEYRDPRFKVVLHNQLSAQVTSHAGSALVGLGRGAEPRRWFPLQADLADGPNLRLREVLEWAYGAVTLGPVTVTVGRQPVTFGRGKLWQPMDLVTTFSLTEVDSQYKPGADALRLDWTVRPGTRVTAVAAAGRELRTELDLASGGTLVRMEGDLSLRGSTFLARATHAWSSGEAGLLAGHVRGDVVLGADGVWDMGSLDLHAEATITLITGESLGHRWPAQELTAAARAVVGLTAKPLARVAVVPELYYNGFGARNPEDYYSVLLSDRVAAGELYNAGSLYLGITCLWEAHPLLNVTLAGVMNLHDPSGLISLGAAYSVAQDVELVAGMYLPLARAADVSSVPADGVPQPLAGQVPVPRSEFGLYPYFFFVELKAAL